MFDYVMTLWRDGSGHEEVSTIRPTLPWIPARKELATRQDWPTREPAPSVQISPSTIVRRRVASWSRSAVELVQATQTGKVVTEYQGPWHLLVAYENGARHDGEATVNGDYRSNLKEINRKLTLVPAGHRYSEWYDSRLPLLVTFFFLDPQSLSDGDMCEQAATPLIPKLFFEDPILWATVSKITALIQRLRPPDKSYLDALGSVLLHEARRVSDESRPVEPLFRGGLAAWQQRTAIDYIESHVDSDVSLAALAALVHLSPQHFCRAFRQSLGQPPGRYHAHRRIEKAKLLLGNPKCSVTDVGFNVGYSDTSSFTTAFRRATGLTPTEFRRSLM
jgi:AraC family transcriptional regulator